MGNSINILLGQSFTHIADSEDAAQTIVEQYKSEYTVKKSNIVRKIKKGTEYFVVTVVVEHLSEKDGFITYFGE
ncbi:MAG TPA: hypothetical protein VK190_04635 [Pseudoneobacillus sp.]|nr:hypothetical protein [Pseudoneobacillus sp.]